MAAKDRIQAIKQMVANDKKVTVSNLSSIFQVTEETIRRDLEKLEDEGFLTRTYGGAVLNSAVLADNIHFYKRAKSFYEEKQIIARNTLPFIKNKTTMAADSSSTVMELLKLLKDRNDLTLLTNSAEAFHDHCLPSGWPLTQQNNKLLSLGKGVFAALAIICRFFWHNPGENNPGKDNLSINRQAGYYFYRKMRSIHHLAFYSLSGNGYD